MCYKSNPINFVAGKIIHLTHSIWEESNIYIYIHESATQYTSYYRVEAQ